METKINDMTKEMEDLNKKIEETNTLSLAYEEAIDKL
jgi:flagellar hook-associated protein FlgK